MSVDAVVGQIDCIRADPERRGELVALLRNDHEVHRGRAAVEVVRLRAFVMQTFAEIGLPDEALPYVIAELETGDHADILVAAARALRGGVASSVFVPVLDRAAENARNRDEYVSFAAYDAVGTPQTGVTATQEIAATRRWITEQTQLGRCCGELPTSAAGVRRIAPAHRREPPAIELEDHDGERRGFAEMFGGKPTIVALFYTRCENPRKCSLTITKLARVQALLARRGRSAQIAIAAITYDPDFDSPRRLRAYGVARGFVPSAHHRLVRTPDGIGDLIDHLGCDVGRVGAVVSRHRVELFVLDARGRVAVAFEHRDWDEHRVVAEALALGGTAITGEVARALPAIGLALVPKCPLCWAAYASAAGVAGVEAIGPWLGPILALLVAANVAVAWLRARRTAQYVPFGLTALGAIAIVPLGLVLGMSAIIPYGAAATVAGSLLAPVLGARRVYGAARAARTVPTMTY